MMFEKDLDAIKNVINDFLLPFELNCEIGTDFSYYYNDNLVEVSLVTIDRASKNFLDFVEKEFNFIHADIFLWSLLHEIGHHETLDDLDDDAYELSQEIKRNLQTDNNIKDEVRDYIYFNLYDEYIATEWAANYMEEHYQEVKEFWNKLQPLILNFYKKYEIER